MIKLTDFLIPVPENQRKTVAVPFANDPDIIRCISQALAKNIANFILLGEEDKIRDVASRQGVDISRAEFVRETDENVACDRAAALVHNAHAQALMKGLVQTSSFISAILHKEYGLIIPGKLLSCVAIAEIPAYHKPLFITDPAVNIAPTLEGKANILKNAVELARKLGIERPKVACVEAIEKVTPKMPSTAEAHALKEMCQQGLFGPAEVEGPLGFDVAVSRKAASVKGVKGNVAGDPDILLLPDIRTANVLYKCLVWFAHATIASIVVGAKVPIILTSRSDSEDIRLVSVALAVHVAAKG